MKTQVAPDLYYLYILSSNMYVFFYKEEQNLKFAKWEARALKGKYVGFDSYTIY